MNSLVQDKDYFYCVKDKTFSGEFPPTSRALVDPDGLLAMGGRLNTMNLLKAYKNGIFPWYTDESPLLWWSPKERPVIAPDRLKISSSLSKIIKKKTFKISYDKCFDRVIENCATIRERKSNSWITTEMKNAYMRLHQLGHAHSVECWQNNILCGGLYGVSIGQIFFGESMFSHKSDASKVALADLCRNLIRWDYKIVDCQVSSKHLESLGAENITRDQFEVILTEHIEGQPSQDAWARD